MQAEGRNGMQIMHSLTAEDPVTGSIQGSEQLFGKMACHMQHTGFCCTHGMQLGSTSLQQEASVVLNGLCSQQPAMTHSGCRFATTVQEPNLTCLGGPQAQEPWESAVAEEVLVLLGTVTVLLLYSIR